MVPETHRSLDHSTVAICIATANREPRLRALLQSIAEIERPTKVVLRVIVVDNGTLTPVQSDATELSDLAGMPVTLLTESTRSIPHTRNRCVEAALPTDFVLFVDDDELVSRSWLRTLLEVQQAHHADVVAGPVVATYPDDAPKWAESSGVYERERRPTGTPLELAATGNTLVRGAVFEEMTEWFDESLALTGGSDSEFFDRVHRSGSRMVWADDAVVTEAVSPERLRVRWVLRRNYRIGIGMARRIQRNDDRRRRRRAVKQAGIALVRVMVAAPFVPMNHARAVAEGGRAARAFGRAAGHMGLTYEEYA